jgi:hypothetical protein
MPIPLPRRTSPILARSPSLLRGCREANEPIAEVDVLDGSAYVKPCSRLDPALIVSVCPPPTLRVRRCREPAHEIRDLFEAEIHRSVAAGEPVE